MKTEKSCRNKEPNIQDMALYFNQIIRYLVSVFLNVAGFFSSVAVLCKNFCNGQIMLFKQVNEIIP